MFRLWGFINEIHLPVWLRTKVLGKQIDRNTGFPTKDTTLLTT